jgi:hypothetical protein
MSKKICRFCQTDQYENKYSEHLKRKHSNVTKAREMIKNTIKFMDEKQLWKVIDFLNEIKKDD